MKINVVALAVSVLLNGVLLACTSGSDLDGVGKAKQAEAAGYESIMDIPVTELTCYTGGKGESECKVEPGIKIGDFVTTGCGVKCEAGFYACCGVRCVCLPEK